MVKGYSLIIGKGVFHIGRYAKGYWFDWNDILRKPVGEKIGFGIKIDFAIGRMIRPIPYFWKLDFYKKDKPVIRDILDKGEEYSIKFFGDRLYYEIMQLEPYQWEKRTIWNPWYALHKFVLRLPIFIWPSFSMGTPWMNFHIGSKSFKVDPFTRDRTWCRDNEKLLAARDEPRDSFYTLALSTTLRNTRD